MKILLFSILLCFTMTSVAVAQSMNSLDYGKLSKTQFEFNPSFAFLVSQPNIGLGYSMELALRKDGLLGGFYGEYSQDHFHSVKVSTGSFSTVKIIDKDVRVYQVGLFGEYSPFNSNSLNPYVIAQAGVIFANSQTAYVLSGGMGLEFLIKNFKPFVQISYQKTILKSIENLDQNGLKIAIGTRISF